MFLVLMDIEKRQVVILGNTCRKDESRMGSSQRNKGASGERELVKVLQDKGFKDVRRGYVYLGQPDVIGLPGIHIEVKRVEKLDIKKAMEQAVVESHKKKGGTPAVFHRVNRGKWYVTMRDFEFMELFNHENPFTWEYIEIKDMMVTTLLDEWVKRYEVLL